MVGQPVEQRRGHLRVGEDGWPFSKGEIGRQDDRGALVEPADQVEQHLVEQQAVDAAPDAAAPERRRPARARRR